MSQVFAGDSVNSTAAITVTTTGETTAITGNFLNPPFGNAKAIVLGQLYLSTGTGTTTVNVRIRRNPNAENLALVGTPNINVTAGNSGLLSVQVADAIPDGRPVQYALTVQQAGATGNGSILEANITTLLISG
jgi:hypothetical protein